MAASRWDPRAKAEGSLNVAASVDVGAIEPDGAGDGVAGASAVVFEDGAGAAGVAGVCAVAGAGVDGAFAPDDEPAGAALGFAYVRIALLTMVTSKTLDTLVYMQTMNPFSSILYDSTVFASCNIFPYKIKVSSWTGR